MNIEVLPVVDLDEATFRKYMAVVYRLKNGSLEPVYALGSHVQEAIQGISEYGTTLYIKAADLSDEDRIRFSDNLQDISINPDIAIVSEEEFSQDEKLLPSNIDGGKDIFNKYSDALYRYSGGKLSPLLHYSGDISELFDPSVRVRTFYVLKKLPEPVAERLATVHENDIIVLGDIPRYLEGGTVSPVSPTL